MRYEQLPAGNRHVPDTFVSAVTNWHGSTRTGNGTNCPSAKPCRSWSYIRWLSLESPRCVTLTLCPKGKARKAPPSHRLRRRCHASNLADSARASVRFTANGGRYL